MTGIDDVLRLGQALVDRVEIDNNGMMIGQIWQGGNGGLHSPETIRAADQLRKAIYAYWHGAEQPPPDPEAAAALRARAKETLL